VATNLNANPAPAVSNDPYESAMAATPIVMTSFGQIDVDIHYCILQKGAGKILFDPQQHSLDQRRTAITLTLNPLPNARFPQPMKRDMIAESNEWARIVKLSIAKVGTDLRSLKGKWVKVRLPITGTYVASDGTTKNRTTFEFVTVYRDEAQCQAEADAFFAALRATDNLGDVVIDPPAATSTPANDGGTAASTVDRPMALKFVLGLWKASKGDVADFEHKLQSSKVTEGLRSDDPDVLKIISA